MKAWTTDRPGRRNLVLAAVAGVALIALLYVLLPALAGLDDTWDRLSTGDPVWLVAAAAFEVLSFACYMAFFGVVFADPEGRIPWRISYLITMAGVVATRVLAAAGAGGIALTAWALQRTGLPRRRIAVGMGAFYILLYAVFMASLVIFGLGLWWGVFSGPAPRGLTLVPAIFAAVVICSVLLIAALSTDLEAALERLNARRPDAGPVRKFLAAVPATIRSGVTWGFDALRSPRPGLLGAIGWWAFDIAVLWASLRAFGTPPTAAVIVVAYFVGMLANTLPVPGGIGAVDGGMIGALIGFGVAGGLAIVGVLTYRAFAFWLPMIPGTIAYVRLLREPEAERGLGRL